MECVFCWTAGNRDLRGRTILEAQIGTDGGDSETTRDKDPIGSDFGECKRFDE